MVGNDMNENVIASSLLSVTSALTAFPALLPPLSDVRKATGNADMTNDVRMGEAAASALVISTGIIASTLTKSPIPAMAATLAALGLVCMYESVLSATPKETKS